MDILSRFNGDKNTRTEVLNYLNYFVATYASEMVLTRKDVSGIADAKDIINKAFENLDIIYAVPERTGEQTNQAK